MSATPDHYEILGISQDASTEEIERARKVLARYWHPDLNKQPDAARHFDAVQKAAEVLRDPRLRAEYDRDFAPRAATNIPHTRPRTGPPAETFHVRPMYVPYAQPSPGNTHWWYTPPGHPEPEHTNTENTNTENINTEHADAEHAHPGPTWPHAEAQQTRSPSPAPGRRDPPRKVVLLAGLAVLVIVAGAVTAYAINRPGATPVVRSQAIVPVAGTAPAGTGPAGPATPDTDPGTLALPRYSGDQTDLPVSDGQVLSIGPAIALLNAHGVPLWHELARVNSLNGGTAASGGLQTRGCAVASGAAGRDYDFVSLRSGQQTVVAVNPPQDGSFALTGDAVALPDGTIRNPCTGTVTARAAPRSTFTSTECLLGTTVIGTGRSGQMAWRNGHRLWQIRTRNRLVCDNNGAVVMLNPVASRISYLNPVNGATRWTVRDPTCARRCVSHSAVRLLGEDQVLILTDANQVLALNQDNGRVLWQRTGACALQARITPNQAVLLGSCAGQSANSAVATVARLSSGATISTHRVSLTGCGQGSEWRASSHRLLVVCPDPAAPSPTDHASLVTW